MTNPTSSKPTAAQPRPKRQKIDHACDLCRQRKVKCDGNRNGCQTCAKRSDLICHYSVVDPTDKPSDKPGGTMRSLSQSSRSGSSTTQPTPARVVKPESHPSQIMAAPAPGLMPPRSRNARGGGGHQPVPALPPTSGSHNASGSAISPPKIDSMNNLPVEGESTAWFGEPCVSHFTQQIKDAVDPKTGGTPPAVLATASAISSLSTNNNNNNNNNTPAASQKRKAKMAAPALKDAIPRRQIADRLASQYWRYVDPLYPFLDKAQWLQSYEGLFSGSLSEADERLFVSTLNVIFALSSQILEDVPQAERQSSELYFRRAQQVLRLDLWESGSVELVQCLLLMSQYLQSTNNSHQTWMVVGAAIRIAVSLGLHLREPPTEAAEKHETELLRRIWHGCVLMDRMVSFTHGRPAVISGQLASDVPLPLCGQKIQLHPNNDNNKKKDKKDRNDNDSDSDSDTDSDSDKGMVDPNVGANANANANANINAVAEVETETTPNANPDPTTDSHTDPNPDPNISARDNKHSQEVPTIDLSHVAFFVKSIELYEIVNTGLQSERKARKARPHRRRPPVPHLGTVMDLDRALIKWEKNVPERLRYPSNLAEEESEMRQRQALILRMRFLHARMLLLRPMLTRICDQSRPQRPPEMIEDTLRDRVIKECASFCVVLARLLIALLVQQYRHQNGGLGLQPAWWYRVHYIYSAALIVTAAKTRPDLFPPADIRESCDDATAFLKIHEQFGDSVKTCSKYVASVASKTPNVMEDIAAAPMPGIGGAGPAALPPSLTFPDAFLGNQWQQPYPELFNPLPFAGEPMPPLDGAQLYGNVCPETPWRDANIRARSESMQFRGFF